MALTDWLSPSGLAALAKIGWPEWDGHKRLWRDSTDFYAAYIDRVGEPFVPLSQHAMDDHAALCIIRDWAVKKLKERYGYIGIEHLPLNVLITTDVNGAICTLAYCTDYDAALIAAIEKGMK